MLASSIPRGWRISIAETSTPSTTSDRQQHSSFTHPFRIDLSVSNDEVNTINTGVSAMVRLTSSGVGGGIGLHLRLRKRGADEGGLLRATDTIASRGAHGVGTEGGGRRVPFGGHTA